MLHYRLSYNLLTRIWISKDQTELKMIWHQIELKWRHKALFKRFLMFKNANRSAAQFPKLLASVLYVSNFKTRSIYMWVSCSNIINFQSFCDNLCFHGNLGTQWLWDVCNAELLHAGNQTASCQRCFYSKMCFYLHHWVCLSCI